ncbi:hypothetical protein U9M48_028894 [Paspalum notatum var. saurae]|uniref:Glycosyltransferase n=1 Tax=Paspalum notatum var. saurae TaxID=547442 RepID=A0AAQ3TXN9_PASNO
MRESPGELNGGGATPPHALFIPSAGMGHLMPTFRVIAGLSRQGIDVSVVTVLPAVSAAETNYFNGLFADYPTIGRVDMHLLPLDASEFRNEDPFFLRWEALRRSVVHLLGPIIASASPPITAIITDITLTSCVIPIAKELRLPCHVLFPTAATMLAVNAYFPIYLDMAVPAAAAGVVGDVDVPGVFRVPRCSLPPPLLDVNKLFTKQFIENSREITKADGVLVNTFDAVEPAPLAALRGGRIVPGYPPVYTIGPLKPHVIPKAGEKTAAQGRDGSPSLVDEWLGQQPARSVVYVSFGNRSAARLDQIREIAAGLEASGHRFLWVLKTTKVDREDDAELADVLGGGYLERVQGRGGLVTKGWVEQEALLKHPAMGMFLSHGGWNSALEAACAGVPLLVWPQLGDHRVNAMAAVRAGIGAWAEHWGWDGDGDGEESLVTGEEIAEKVKDVMADAALRESVAVARLEAAKAVAEGGTSYRNMREFVGKIKQGA